MFIIIDESGTVFKASEISESDLVACDAGLVSIVDTKKEKEFFEDEWIDIPIWQ